MEFILELFGKPKNPPDVHFYDIKFSQLCQNDFENGKHACTYCALECALYILSDIIPFDGTFVEISRYIKKITQRGASMKQIEGFTSCDDVFKLVERYKKAMKMKIIYHGKVKDSDTFYRFLERILNESHKTKQTVCTILTKPPETICVTFEVRKRRWIIYDSHKRYFDGKQFGSALYYFKTIQDCTKHLKLIFRPIVHRNIPYEIEMQRNYNLYEGTIVILNDDRTDIGKVIRSKIESSKSKQQLPPKPNPQPNMNPNLPRNPNQTAPPPQTNRSMMMNQPPRASQPQVSPSGMNSSVSGMTNEARYQQIIKQKESVIFTLQKVLFDRANENEVLKKKNEVLEQEKKQSDEKAERVMVEYAKKEKEIVDMKNRYRNLDSYVSGLEEKVRNLQQLVGYLKNQTKEVVI